MSFLRDSGGGDTHHHGILAGVSAGAVAVIVIPLLAIWLARHLITQALGVVIWALAAAVVAAVIAGVLFVGRLLWHKHVQFTAAAPARPGGAVVRAEVLPAEPAPLAVPAASAAGAPVHLHLPEGMPLEEVAALLGRFRAGERPELPGGGLS